MSFEKNLQKYGELVINEALKIKEGDTLVIRAEAELYKFVNMLAEIAFKSGAKDVKVNYRDENFSKIKFEYASIETLKEVPKYFIDEQNEYMNIRAKFLSIIGRDPDIYKDVDPQKVKESIFAKSTALKNFNAKMMNNETSWCVIGAATPSWAKAVFPDLDEDKALEKLWDLIFYTTRVDKEDPKKAWEEHIQNLKKWSDFLNNADIDYLHYTSKKGTDLKVKLPKGYIFSGASEYNRLGEEFVANMPTEEVFSMPHRDGIDGIIYNTKPLNYNGILIDEFWLKFENGRVIDFNAEVGYETLKHLLDTDEGSRSFGEIALVPYDSPISNTNVLFYETLFDENASCHFALGKAYPTCIKGGESMSEDELLANGVNDSLIHVDFMVGDETTNIVATTHSGDKIQIFKDGNFVI